MSIRNRKLKRGRYFIKNGRTFRDGSKATYYADGSIQSYKCAKYLAELERLNISESSIIDWFIPTPIPIPAAHSSPSNPA